MNMREIVTLAISEHVVCSARVVVARTHRRVEGSLVEWMDEAAAEVPVDCLSNEETLG
jgi:hypothetical protein